MTTETLATAPRRALDLRIIGQFGVIAAVLVLIGLFALIRPDFLSIFFNPNNLANIGRQTTLLAIMGFAMTLVILSGEIDISLGAIASMCGVVMALIIVNTGSWLLAIPVGIAIGAALGFVNGFITVRGGIPSFIVTLGTLNVVQGLALALTNASTITLPANPSINQFRDLFARGVVTIPATEIQIPHPVIIVVLLLIALTALLTRTRFGLNIYAVGGGAASARLAGIAVGRVKIAVFTLSGAVAALAAVVYTARLGNGQPLGMIGYELDAIAAVVIGGTSFTGGRGAVWRTVLGALLIGVLNNALTLMNVNFNLQLVVRGVVIVVAVMLDAWTRRGTKN
ncbi:MAG: ABC transporter permease [Chloroflexota bacterium]|nr:ABC transporter permease [Chloroflexota bacterium]